MAGRWEVLTTVDPADERAHLELIAALARRGDRRAALRQFERLERALRAELGVAPSRSAERLRQRLLAEVSADPASPTPGGAVPPPALASEHGAQQVSTDLAPLDLLGRDRERERLERLVSEMSTGHGRTLFVGGPAGIGKTAILAWLEKTCTASGIRIGTATAAQIEGAWPYAPVLEALADLCRRHPALLDGLDDALREEIERALSGRETTWRAQSGDQRLFVAAAELLRLAAAGSGAVLVVDDAHDADDASMRLLHYLARSTQSDRVLIVIAHRPEMCPALAQIRQSLLGRGKRGHPGPDDASLRGSFDAGAAARPAGGSRSRRRGLGNIGGAAVRGGRARPEQRRRPRLPVDDAARLPSPRSRSTHWPPRPCWAVPSTPTNSSP